MTGESRSTGDVGRQSRPEGQLLVVGGYGAVGRVVALRLVRWFPDRVVVAGRSADRAQALARSAAGAVVPRSLDVQRAEDVRRAIEGASAVVMCVERANEGVARVCLEHGVHYVDVSASAAVLTSISRLNDLAVPGGATAVLSVGLAPGLTNLLARRSAQQLPGARAVDVAVLLGLGEHHGLDAVRWTVKHLGAPLERGGDAAGPERVPLPGFGVRTAYPFPFSDQYTLRETLGLRATTRLCFDSAALTWAIFALRGVGLFSLVRRLNLAGLLAAGAARVHVGGDRFAVRASASDGRGAEVAWAATGRNAGRATGIVAAHVVRELHRRRPPPGVLHIDQLVDPSALFAELAKEGIAFHQS